MPNYSNSPPTDAAGPALPIMRTPATSKLRAVITSTDLLGTNTHFWGGHTVPCSAPECEACRKGVPFRWHAYLTAYIPPKALHFLYEMTATAAQVICDFRRDHPNLRGYEFEAYRWRSNPHGRVMLRLSSTKNEALSLPAEPHLPAVLAILWQLPKANVQPLDTRQLAREVAVNLHVPGQNDPPNPMDGCHGEAV